MQTDISPESPKEISCRITRTLLMYVRETNNGTLGNLLEGLSLDEEVSVGHQQLGYPMVFCRFSTSA